MKARIAQIDITPKPGVELSGFAARIQPSTGVLDPLFAKALYLADGQARVLWIHCDLVGLIARSCWNSASGRRSGWDWLRARSCFQPRTRIPGHARSTCRSAAAMTLPTWSCCSAGCAKRQRPRWLRQRTAIWLRPKAISISPWTAASRSASIPTRGWPALGFRRSDGTFKAVVVNYPMHPVALGSSNRQISADIPGQAALRLSRQLPGNPVALITNGACGNLNPPAENVPFAQIEAWGGQIAEAVAAGLKRALPAPRAQFRVAARIFPLPLDALDVAGIEAFAKKALQDTKSLAEWGDKYRRVVEHWRSSLVGRSSSGGVIDHRDAELFVLRLGDVILLGANAEVFSEFTDWLRAGAAPRRSIWWATPTATWVTCQRGPPMPKAATKSKSRTSSTAASAPKPAAWNCSPERPRLCLGKSRARSGGHPACRRAGHPARRSPCLGESSVGLSGRMRAVAW